MNRPCWCWAVLAGVWILCTPRAVSNGEARGDVLLLKNPEKLVVYNQYQVTIGARDPRRFSSYAPLRILRHDAVLADRFTHTTLVASGDQQFYLLKDENGALNPASKPLIFKDVTYLSDTVRILRGGSMSIVSPDRSRQRALTTGELVFTHFRDRDRVYVQTADGTPAFGWVTLTPRDQGKRWEFVVTAPSVVREFPPALIAGVRQKLQSMNALLDSLFTRLNLQNSQQRIPPVWHLSARGPQVSCELDPASQRPAFGTTTSLLARDIETILLGKPVSMTVSPGTITLSLNGL